MDPATAVQMAAAFEAEVALLVDELMQGESERKAKQRERKQRSRDRHAVSRDVTGQDVTFPKTKVPPTPPSKTQPLSPPSPPTGAHGSKSNGFDRFWEAYPRKVGKGAARPKWDRAVRKAEPAEILAALERAKHDWREVDAQFVPHPATWLSQERWLDEPMAQATGPPVARVDPDFLARQLARLQNP